MALSSITGVTSGVAIKDVPNVETNVTESRTVGRYENQEIENMIGTEQYVREYFSDIPIMVVIAKCESNFRQLNRNGEIHRGIVNDADVGVMQINEFYHLDTAQKKKYNIYIVEGNTAYARDLYQRQGTVPWSSSKACWGKYQGDSKALAVNSK